MAKRPREKECKLRPYTPAHVLPFAADPGERLFVHALFDPRNTELFDDVVNTMLQHRNIDKWTPSVLTGLRDLCGVDHPLLRDLPSDKYDEYRVWRNLYESMKRAITDMGNPAWLKRHRHLFDNGASLDCTCQCCMGVKLWLLHRPELFETNAVMFGAVNDAIDIFDEMQLTGNVVVAVNTDKRSRQVLFDERAYACGVARDCFIVLMMLSDNVRFRGVEDSDIKFLERKRCTQFVNAMLGAKSMESPLAHLFGKLELVDANSGLATISIFSR